MVDFSLSSGRGSHIQHTPQLQNYPLFALSNQRCICQQEVIFQRKTLYFHCFWWCFPKVCIESEEHLVGKWKPIFWGLHSIFEEYCCLLYFPINRLAIWLCWCWEVQEGYFFRLLNCLRLKWLTLWLYVARPSLT